MIRDLTIVILEVLGFSKHSEKMSKFWCSDRGISGRLTGKPFYSTVRLDFPSHQISRQDHWNNLRSIFSMAANRRLERGLATSLDSSSVRRQGVRLWRSSQAKRSKADRNATRESTKKCRRPDPSTIVLGVFHAMTVEEIVRMAVPWIG